MSQYNPYQPMTTGPADPTSIRKVSVRPFELFKRGRELIGEQYWLFVGISLVGMLIGSVVPMGLMLGVMLVGVYHCMMQRERGYRVEFSMLFKGFEDLGPPLIATLVFMGVYLAALMPLICGLFGFMILIIDPSQKAGGPTPGLPMVTLLLFELLIFAIIILVMIPFTFTFQLIADRGLPAMEAVKTSVRGAMKNFWGLLWFFVVNMFVSTVLAILCYFPAFLFLPISFAATYLLYRDVFPRDAVLQIPGG